MDHHNRDRMDSIPLHRVALVHPFVDYLADSDAPVERGLQQVGLPVTAFETLNNHFPDTLIQALHAYIQESDLSIEFAAELCNTSKRSLQRKLMQAGTRYSEVLDQVRFDAARP